MKKIRLRNAKGQFKKASKVSEFGFVKMKWVSFSLEIALNNSWNCS